MEIVGLGLSFGVPPDWTQFKDGNRFVFQSPAREELIVSGRLIMGKGSEAERTAIVERVVENAREAALRTAADPELRVTFPLQEVACSGVSRIWRIDAESRDGAIRFFQAIVSHAHGMALFSYEAPLSQSAQDTFGNILHSVAVTAAVGNVA